MDRNEDAQERDIEKEENSEDDADPEDGMWSDLKNLFPNNDASEKSKSQDSLLVLHSQDSQEYFSPTEDNRNESEVVGSSNVLEGKKGCPSEQEKETVQFEYEKTHDTVSKCFQCSLKSVASVAVQCEPLTVMTQQVRSERMDYVSQEVQCELVLQVDCGIQCEHLCQDQSVQCELLQPELCKNMLSKSMCNSPVLKDTQCETSVASVGINCDLIDTAEMRQSKRKNENSTPEQRIDVLQVHCELDDSCLVSSSQTSLYICNSSSGSPSVCEMKMLSECTSEHSLFGNTTKCHKEDNTDRHYELNQNSSRSAFGVLEKSNNEMRGCERKTKRSKRAKKTLFTQSDKHSDMDASFECSSQELLLEMGDPTRCSGTSKDITDHSTEHFNRNKQHSKMEESSEIVQKDNSGWQSQDRLSRKRETSRDACSSSPLGTERMYTLQFNSLAVERASSPESLDDETCTELSRKATRRTLYSRVQLKDVNSLLHNPIQRKVSHPQVSTNVAEGRCGTKSSNYSNLKLCQDLPVRRKRTNHDTSNISKPVVTSTPKRGRKLVAYSDSENSQGSSHSDFHESGSSSGVEMVAVVRKSAEEKSSASTSGKSMKPSNITNFFSKQQRLTSHAERTDASFERSVRLRGRQDTNSAANAKEPSRIEGQVSSDSDFDSDDTCTVTCRTTISRLSGKSQRRSPYTFKEREAIIYYIIDHKYFKRVKGRAMWEQMEDAQICPRRTWQSLKEHFIKQILPKIETYKLPSSVEKRFINARR